MDYGFGAVLDVPHMINEIWFAKKYKLEIKTVVKPFDKDDNYHVTNEANWTRYHYQPDFSEWLKLLKTQ